MTDFWSTRELGTADQVSYWADVLCQAFTPLAPSRTRDHLGRSRVRAGLPGWVRSAPFGAINAAEISSCTQLVEHGDLEVSRTTEDVVFVNLQIAGQCFTEQDGRRCVVSRGEFAIVDSTRPYSLEFVEPQNSPQDEPQLWRVLSFRLPRESVADLMSDPSRAATARTFAGDRGSAHIARSLMVSTWQSSDSVASPAERQLLGTAHADVIRAVLAGARKSQTAPSPVTDDERRAAALRYIDTHLPFGSVSAAEAARAIGVSVRTLHAVFERSGTTFGAVARQRRLQACARDLLAGDATRPIAVLAAQWGYADSAHMARAFRTEFGCTPTEYRRSIRVPPTGAISPLD